MKKDQKLNEALLSRSTWSRRDCLKIMLAAGAGSAFSGLPALAKTNTQLLRAIPKSGEQIPAMGMGTSDTFDVGVSAAARASAKEVLRLFIDNGGRLVDTSPMYGNAETVTGDLAAELSVQKHLFIATKVWTDDGSTAGEKQMETSMERLRTQRIDLMQVHNLVDWRTHLTTLRAWKKQSRIRYLGITHYDASAYDQLTELIKNEDLDFVQFNYSIVTRAAENLLLPLAADKGTAVLINRAFEDGALFSRVRGKEVPAWAAEFDCYSWSQFFLKYVLAHPAVTCVIPATSKPKHLMDNMGAGLGRLPDEKTRLRMISTVEAL